MYWTSTKERRRKFRYRRRPVYSHRRITNRVGEVPNDRPIMTVCRSGKRSVLAFSILQAAGRDKVANISGCYWKQKAAYQTQADRQFDETPLSRDNDTLCLTMIPVSAIATAINSVSQTPQPGSPVPRSAENCTGVPNQTGNSSMPFHHEMA